MRFRQLNWIGFALLSACAPPGPKPVELPSAAGVHYRVLLRTFQDGAYADQPFHLSLIVPESTLEPKTVLQAQQCKNVSVAQTPNTLYVFYDELSLNRFGTKQYYASEPRVLLCDLHNPLCTDHQRKLAQAGVGFSNVCTYRTKRLE